MSSDQPGTSPSGPSPLPPPGGPPIGHPQAHPYANPYTNPYAGQGANPYAWTGHGSEPPPSTTLAAWALGAACVPCVLTQVVGLVLAVVVLVRCRDGRDHGKGLAIGAIAAALGWLLLLGGLTALGFAIDAENQRDEGQEPGELAEGDSVESFALEVGDCVMLPDEDEDLVRDVTSVPCDKPHEAEVYATVRIGGTSWPGEDEVIDQADRRCEEEFGRFVGMPYQDSELEMFYLYPTKSSWNLNDDREASCWVVAMPEGTTVTGSLEGARR